MEKTVQLFSIECCTLFARPDKDLFPSILISTHLVGANNFERGQNYSSANWNISRHMHNQ